MNATLTEEDNLIFMEGVAQEPPRVLIYGPEKIGKTTFGASAPKPIFVRTEDGAEHIGPARLPLAKSYEQVIDQVSQIALRKHDRETIVIDSLDWLEKLIFAKVCKESGVKSIELAAGGYGKGFTRAGELMFDLLTEHLDPLRTVRGMAVILLAHDKTEKAEEPGLPSYDRSTPRLDKRSLPYVKDWADAIGYACRRIRIEGDEASRGNRNIAHAIGSERQLIVSGLKPSCISGNRYGITEDLPLSWDAFAKAAFKA